MRIWLFLCAGLLAVPLQAQDQSAHSADSAHDRRSADGESGQPAADHCAMGHLPAGKCPPRTEKTRAAPFANPATEPAKEPQMDHGSRHPANHRSAPRAAREDAVPPRALSGPRHAADAIWGADAMTPSRQALARGTGAMQTGTVLIERLEARVPTSHGGTGYLWDAQAWYGGDINRLVLKTEGQGEFDGGLEDAEIQALYSRAIGPFFDLQAGVRLDTEPGTRTHLVIGLQGLAPYMVHVDGALFLSDRGDLTARIKGEYDQKITQKLILQPRLEIELAAQAVAGRAIGAGVTKIEPGVRLRYEIKREFAPYVGFEYHSALGASADLARAAGADPDGFRLLAGIRTWF